MKITSTYQGDWQEHVEDEEYILELGPYYSVVYKQRDSWAWAVNSSLAGISRVLRRGQVNAKDEAIAAAEAAIRKDAE